MTTILKRTGTKLFRVGSRLVRNVNCCCDVCPCPAIAEAIEALTTVTGTHDLPDLGLNDIPIRLVIFQWFGGALIKQFINASEAVTQFSIEKRSLNRTGRVARTIAGTDEIYVNGDITWRRATRAAYTQSVVTFEIRCTESNECEVRALVGTKVGQKYYDYCEGELAAGVNQGSGDYPVTTWVYSINETLADSYLVFASTGDFFETAALSTDWYTVTSLDDILTLLNVVGALRYTPSLSTIMYWFTEGNDTFEDPTSFNWPRGDGSFTNTQGWSWVVDSLDGFSNWGEAYIPWPNHHGTFSSRTESPGSYPVFPRPAHTQTYYPEGDLTGTIDIAGA